MATNLIIEATNASGKKVSKAFPSVKTTASDYELKTFAVAMTGLTGNTFTGAIRVDRKDITDARSPRDPQLTITPNEVELSAFDKSKSVTFTVSYLGADRAFTYSGKKPYGGTIEVNGKTITITGDRSAIAGTATGTITISLPATADYDAATETISILHGNAEYGFEDI